MLDVGCGGGILAEALARLGAHVTGADASAESVAVARAHAAGDPTLSVAYRAATAEQLVAEGAYGKCGTCTTLGSRHIADTHCCICWLFLNVHMILHAWREQGRSTTRWWRRR